MEPNRLTGLDMSLLMDRNIKQKIPAFFQSVHNTAAVETRAVEACDVFVETMEHLEADQRRLVRGRWELKELVAEAKAFDGNKEGMAAMVEFVPDMKEKNSEQINFLLEVLDDLLADTSIVNSALKVLQAIPNLPATGAFTQYIAWLRVTFTILKKYYDKILNQHSRRRNIGVLGEEYGLRVFEDIVYSWDGHLMTWSDIDEDWQLAETTHPCREIADDWSKYFFDMTPNDFFSQHKRASIDWVHASPLKKLLESLQTTHFLANSAAPGPAPDESNQRIRKRNMQIAATTGMPYPLYDTENLERTIFHSDRSELSIQPLPSAGVNFPENDELSRTVEEVATGVAPVIRDIQELERFSYRLPQ